MNAHILVVEDDDILREIYSLRLSMEGYSVDTARDGIDGLEKVKAVKAKVLVASNKSSNQNIHEAKLLGAVDYLIKSHLTPDDLVDHVKKHLLSSATHD